MRKIIVPVDFSPTSRDAYLFACEISKVFNASIEVIHVYSGSFSTNEAIVFQPGKGRQEVVEDQLEEFVKQMPEEQSGGVSTKVKVTTKAIQGFTVAKIIKEANACNAYMIVMGTTGKHDVLEKALGSVSTGVAQRASCPVLLIPKGVKYRSFENILYASNYESAREEILYKNIDFANIFRAAMHFIHVSEKDEKDFEAVEEEVFEVLFKEGEPAFAFNLATIPGDSVVRGLNQYAAENNIDLVVLINQHRSFLDNVLGKSVTKELGLYTKVPVMVYPISVPSL